MLDLVGIVFSTIMITIVVVRAVLLDRTLPWFEKVNLEAEKPAPKPSAAGRQDGAPPSWRDRRQHQSARTWRI